MLLNDTEAKFFGFVTSRWEVNSSIVILCGKDRFAGFDKGQHFILPAIDEIIFYYGKIEMIDQIPDLVGGILDANRHSALMRFVRQPFHILQLVVIGDRET